jgi:hypothetical protein
MLKKLAVTSAAVAAVAGLGLATPAYASPRGPHGEGRGDITQILPIQLCNVPVHVLDLIHDVLSSHDEGVDRACINGPLQADSEHEFANLNVNKHFFFNHRGWDGHGFGRGGFGRGGFGRGEGGFGRGGREGGFGRGEGGLGGEGGGFGGEGGREGHGWE